MGGTGGTGASQGSSSTSGQQQARGGQQGNQQGNQQGGRSQQGGGSQAGGSQAGMADQARNMAGDAYNQASEMAGEAYEQASEWVSDKFRSTGGGRSMRARGGGVQRYVAENPVMVGLVGLAAGLLIGALLPRTRREDEAFGEWADEVREQGMRYAHEMAQRGREFVDENFSGDDPRFAHHESEFRPDQGGANRH
jgi:ElaB/YqjD/DUF883 family membrane-anchored ribosome-binding protein